MNWLLAVICLLHTFNTKIISNSCLIKTLTVKDEKRTKDSCIAVVADRTLKTNISNKRNRQYSYSPTVLGRVFLHHECEAHTGNFSPRGKTSMRKLPLSLPNLRKIFNIVKFRRAYILERSLFQTTKGRFAHYYKEKQRS